MSIDLTGIEFRWAEWLVANGGLNPGNVMEYFSISPFWDPTSNNAVLKMQTNFNSFDQANMDMKQMTGKEFVITKENSPKLFVIQKQNRTSPTQATPIAIYYIVNGNIYQSPDLYSVLANRMLTMINHLNHAFREAYDFVEYNPAEGYRWKIKAPKPEEDKPEESAEMKKAHEFLSSVDRVFMAEGMEKAPTIEEPAKTSSDKKLLSAKEALSKAKEAGKLNGINTAGSTPSSSTEGSKSKRKSESGGKKKKKAKVDSTST